MKGAFNKFELEDNLKRWLEEDMPFGDITTDFILSQEEKGEGNLIAKESGVLCGLDVFRAVYKLIDPEVVIESDYIDGDRLEIGDHIGSVKGSVASILKGERLGLNLMQRLSGIATMSAAYAKEVEGTKAVVVDTRKTTPGLRSLEKYAVRIGGCINHRYSLSDAVLIKDNHIAGAGSITNAVKTVRENIPHTVKVEVEVETFDEMKEAVATKADIIMLDNMTTLQMKEAVNYIRQEAGYPVTIEASGNMMLDRIHEVAMTGVDIISVGALTHSVKAQDISLKFLK